MGVELSLDDRTVEIQRPDKVLFPDAGITKADLARYAALVAPVRSSYVEGRPVLMRRFPDGIDEEGFYQRSVPDHFPEWVDRVVVSREGAKEETLVALGSAATEAYLADQGVVEVHSWSSRRGHLDRPDRLVFDLDPPEGSSFEVVREGAFSLKGLLERVGLAPFAIVTGSKGVHVVAPLEPSVGFDVVRGLARALGRVLVGGAGDRFTLEQRRAKRGGRVFVDVFRNGWGQTAVAPYSVRALPGAPVAAPVGWEELEEVGARSFSLRDVPGRLEEVGDPWRGMDDERVDVSGVVDALP